MINRHCLVALLLCSACAGSGPTRPAAVSSASRPAWVDGDSPRFPRSQYVVGVGSGDDEAAASDRARGEIARVFMSAVNVNTTVDESETSLTQGGKTSSSFSQLIAQNVRTASQKMLEGVEVVERWRDSATGRHYALASLSKSKAMAAVEEKTAALDADAAQWKAKLDAASDTFERAKAAAKLAAVLKGRLELENDRRVLGGGALPSGVDAAAAKSAAAAALAALDVVVAATGDGADQIETGIVSGLAAAGLTAKRGNPGDKGDLVIDAAAESQPVDGGDKRWKWSRAAATVALRDGRADKTFARFTVSDRQASADAAEARRRALGGLAKKASETVSAAIADFFANQ
ncbi:MAG: LPP20 family lipoprotein [Elusimicrobia bacterium]|nr:LPP20 family lipoprotein [Elusimicrobiota bacterium]